MEVAPNCLSLSDLVRRSELTLIGGVHDFPTELAR
jgi:hypothetical protein